MRTVHVVGLSAGGTLLAARLKQRGHDVTMWIDKGEDLAQLSGATECHLSPGDRRIVEDTLKPLGLQWDFGRHEIVTSLGVVRSVDAILPDLLSLARGAMVIVAGFHGWREWPAHLIVDGLEVAGFNAKSELGQMFGTPVDASLHQMAARLSDTVFRQQLVDRLKPHAHGAVQILLPPIASRLKRQSGGIARELLPTELSLSPSQIGEAASSIPSLTGERYLEASVRALAKYLRLRGEGAAPSLQLHRDGVLSLGGTTGDIVIASQRAAAWVEPHIARATTDLKAPDGARAAHNVWFIGRARDARSVGAEWSDALRLAGEWT